MRDTLPIGVSGGADASALPRRLLVAMKRIRAVEERIAHDYGAGRMRCPVHLSIGQEAVAAAVGQALRRNDLAVSGHRAHAHYLAKGGDLTAMLAELLGKQSGCSGGKGGSMHLTDESAGFMGSTAIVGGTVPVGVGLAYGMRLAGTAQVSCVFLGDAVAETGVFFESLNFAALKRLPVLFVCENNLYSVYTPLRARQPEGRAIHRLAAAIGLSAAAGDGNDVEQVHAMTCAALAEIRSGGGPCLLEFCTYRWREHCGPNYDNDIGYRSEAEFAAWRRRDPIARYEAALLQRDALDADDVERIAVEIAAELGAALAAAEAAPFPPPSAALADVYAAPCA
jgi:pyruvate dehydrogenase E1 component alpha subunit